MVTTPQEQEAKKIKKAQVLVDLDVVETSFEKWACDLKQEFGIKVIKNYIIVRCLAFAWG